MEIGRFRRTVEVIPKEDPVERRKPGRETEESPTEGQPAPSRETEREKVTK